jgi:hypothetical protein
MPSVNDSKVVRFSAEVIICVTNRNPIRSAATVEVSQFT